MKEKLVWPHSVLDPHAVSGEPAGLRMVWLESNFEGSSFQVGFKYLIQLRVFFLSFLDLRVIICKSIVFKCGYRILKDFFEIIK